jgi:hypothetical protein
MWRKLELQLNHTQNEQFMPMGHSLSRQPLTIGRFVALFNLHSLFQLVPPIIAPSHNFDLVSGSWDFASPVTFLVM